MANSINYAEVYRKELDQAVKQGLLTAEIETPSVNWIGAKTFNEPHMQVTGYGKHGRNRGWNRGDVTTENTPYTVEQDRDVEFFVDVADTDESGLVATIGNVSKTFLEEQATPEIDAYRFSKMAKEAKGIGGDQYKEEDLSKKDGMAVLKAIKSDLSKVRKYGSVNVVVYVHTAVMDLLENVALEKGIINIKTMDEGISTRITVINGSKVIEVFDTERFYTEYDFTTGYVPTGQEINYIVVAKPSVLTARKINSIYLFLAGTHTEGDGNLYQNRLFHDMFIRKHKSDGVIVSAKPATAGAK